jgi:hypothetical protein
LQPASDQAPERASIRSCERVKASAFAVTTDKSSNISESKTLCIAISRPVSSDYMGMLSVEGLLVPEPPEDVGIAERRGPTYREPLLVDQAKSSPVSKSAFLALRPHCRSANRRQNRPTNPSKQIWSGHPCCRKFREAARGSNRQPSQSWATKGMLFCTRSVTII